jgi:2'-5' RNA ligase
VLWAAVEPKEPLAHIAAQLEHAARSVGLPPETRPFVAHVTLARLTRPDPARVASFLRQHAELTTPELAPHAVVLYESRLSERGALHRPLHTFELVPPLDR